MSESEPGFKRVIVNIHSEIMPELMADLGVFATRHNILIHIGDATGDSVEPSIKVEEEHNPSLVTWVRGLKSQYPIAVITERNFSNFVAAQGHSTERAVRPYMAIARWFNWGRDGDLLSENYFYDDPETKVQGIKPAYLREMVSRLKSGDMEIRNIGPLAIKLLEDYSVALLPDNAKNTES